MKHPVGVAISAGWTAALELAIGEGKLSYEVARWIAHTATVATREYLKGNTVYGRDLSRFAEDGESIENLLTSNKINLQRFGDS